MLQHRGGVAEAGGRPRLGPLPRAAALGLALAAAIVSGSAARAQQGRASEGDEGVNAGRDIINRYRFIQRFATEDRGASPREPGAIFQYRVGAKETQQLIGDPAARPTAPPRGQVRRVIYADRVAGLSIIGRITGLVRRFEKVDLNPPLSPPPMQGLTVWYQPRAGDDPLIVLLTEGKALRDQDYSFAVNQVHYPDLVNLLPPKPVKVGEVWILPRAAALALVAGKHVLEGEVDGKLTNIASDADGPGQVAVMDLKGRLVVQRETGEGMVEMGVAVRAELRFAFTAEAAGGGVSVRAAVPIIDCRGAVTRLSLAQVDTPAQPAGSTARLPSLRREVVLECRPNPDDLNLDVPAQPPEPTVENSWLTLNDPQNRFSLRHPQELHARPVEEGKTSKGQPVSYVNLVHQRPGGHDVVVAEISLSSQRKPEVILNELRETWRLNQDRVIEGEAGYLEQGDWPQGMRVYRIEAAQQGGAPGGPTERIHLDQYVVLFGKDASAAVLAMTTLDPPTKFRADVEQMIKTLQMRPSKTP